MPNTNTPCFGCDNPECPNQEADTDGVVTEEWDGFEYVNPLASTDGSGQ